MYPGTYLDHIVVVAGDLAEGISWTEERLGAALPQSGGKHPLMGTHNRVMRLGEATFLEVIAPDPEAPDPGHARWFDLDTPPAEPCLGHWLVRLPGLMQHRGDLPGINGGVQRQKRGDMRWVITVPEDGRRPFGGVFPSFLDWQCDEADIPPRAMPGGDFSIVSLELAHPRAEQAAGLLAPVLQDERVRWTVADRPSLTARLMGPAGEVVL